MSSTSTPSTSNKSNFQTVNTKSNSLGLKMRFSTKPTHSNMTGTRGTMSKTKFQSGKLDMTQQEDDFENTTITPTNKKIFFFTLFIPCIGFFGFCRFQTQNRREKLWAIAAILYALLMSFCLVVLVIFFFVFY